MSTMYSLIPHGNNYVRYYNPLPKEVSMTARGFFATIAQYGTLEAYTGALIDPKTRAALNQKTIAKGTGLSVNTTGRYMRELIQNNVLAVENHVIYVNPYYASCNPQYDPVQVRVQGSEGKFVIKTALLKAGDGVGPHLENLFHLRDTFDDSELPF